jgi:hypothetical protein
MILEGTAVVSRDKQESDIQYVAYETFRITGYLPFNLDVVKNVTYLSIHDYSFPVPSSSVLPYMTSAPLTSSLIVTNGHTPDSLIYVFQYINTDQLSPTEKTYTFSIVFQPDESVVQQDIMFPFYNSSTKEIVFQSITILFVIIDYPQNTFLKFKTINKNYLLYWCWKGDVPSSSTPFLYSFDTTQYIPETIPSQVPKGYIVIGVQNFPIPLYISSQNTSQRNNYTRIATQYGVITQKNEFLLAQR